MDKPKPPAAGTLRALRSAIYKVDDLARAKAFYAALLGRAPYFDEAFYVGFEVDGQELGLDPDVAVHKPGPGGAVAYWRVDDLAAACALAVASGGKPVEAPHEVGGGISTAIVADVCGNLVGLVQVPS
jgi:predicted enzyme related to lactoylglutathione lyase